ncbi:MAG: ArsC family reductase [Chromatiales bacterium]|nr:ArsC family reductase [Chromatiales bacterium]
MTTLYGIKNCDTMREARTWLKENGVEYHYHDFRGDGLEAERLRGWIGRLGWEALANRRGTTWRKLPEEQRSDLDDGKALALMLRYPAMIKRPVLEYGDTVEVGFSPERYQSLFF